MKKSSVYTKTGDSGTTSLVGGVRVSKTDSRLEAYGTVDELNSYIGLLISMIKEQEIIDILRFVQHKLFALGSYLATDITRTKLESASQIIKDDIIRLESAIDVMDSSLPVLRSFILPGGSHSASVCHICRTVCRRAERRMLELELSGVAHLDNNCKCFINRLSDYFFILSRKLNELSHYEEIYWDKSCK